uniref:Uncharacterized protein n=1 Tax=uncultured bacterium contig00060 TaxID=1181543 RepID=A0A806KES9_9BACT|nr:hypothetical protein [uncultured bacterium contig00060]
MVNMKKQILILLPLIFILQISSCNDPIFYTISQEVKPLPPLIKGSPTNFVEYYGKMYVASGKTIYRYDHTYTSYYESRVGWTEIELDEHINQLAAANGSLYALCSESGNFVLRRFDGYNWSVVYTGYNTLKIYAANNILFIGASYGDVLGPYNILSYDGSVIRILADTEYSLINGAAAYNGTYYLSTKHRINLNGGGIYQTSAPGTPYSAGIANSGPYIGIINLGNTVVAITRNGSLQAVPGFYSVANLGNRPATGALAIWKGDGNTLLLAGRGDVMANEVNYEYGYFEAIVHSSGTYLTSDLHEPGYYPSSVDNRERYRSTIGKLPVNHLYQAPDGILFASTHNKGVYSYRLRDGEWQWNAEQ